MTYSSAAFLRPLGAEDFGGRGTGEEEHRGDVDDDTGGCACRPRVPALTVRCPLAFDSLFVRQAAHDRAEDHGGAEARNEQPPDLLYTQPVDVRGFRR